jgi:chorismate-pyruvate lyase
VEAAPAAPAAPGGELRAAYPPASTPGAAALLRVMIEQDGSMTRLCESLAGAAVELRLRHQRVTREVPPEVRALLPGAAFIERVTSLVAAGRVLTDNLVYVALDGLDPALQDALQTGRRPIGHLMEGRPHRRDVVQVGAELLQRLWATVGVPTPEAMRCYTMRTPEGSAMLVCEALRGGLHDAACRAGAAASAAPLRP